MRQSCDWRQDETHKATWNFLTTSLLLQFLRMKTNKQTKRCVKLHILSKENKTSTELLLGIYLTKLNKEEEEEEGSGTASSRLGQREEAPHPVALSPFPFLLQGQSLSVTDCHADWSYLDFFFSHSILTPPPHPTLCPSPPPTHSPSLSHGALISADQAFNLVMMEDSMLSYA